MTRKKSIHVPYRRNQFRPNYIGPVSNGVTLFTNIFHPWLVESGGMDHRNRVLTVSLAASCIML